jgi:thiol-disulfide isomerase/thioredoxin
VSEPDRPTRLDPDRAIADVRGPAEPKATEDVAGAETRARGRSPRAPYRPAPVIDTRRYQWMIGGFGLLLVFAFSVYLYAQNGSTTPGVAPGQRLHRFVAPLATSGLNATANAHPRCNRARPARRGLNVCGRQPIVLAFFVPDHAPCVREVDTLQQVAHRFPGIKFAAVAVDSDRASTAQLVRRHGWTIPVAYDSTDSIGQIYGIVVCPIVELARPGGTVVARLIGEIWEQPGRLAAAVERLRQAGGGA